MKRTLPASPEERQRRIRDEVIRTLTAIGDRDALAKYLAAQPPKNKRSTK